MAKKKNDIDTDIESNADDLVSELMKQYNKKDIEECELFIPTGSTLLDYCIANKKNGGIPVGRLTEITGEEATGKTLLAAHIIANTQKMGGIGVYIDTEHSLKKDFIVRLGVNWDKLIRPQVQTIEEAFATIEKIINITRTKFPNKEKPVTIVWDSLAATPPQAEIEGDFDPNSLMGVASKAVSKGMRKITETVSIQYVTLVFLNQLRMDFGVKNPYMDKFIAPYGKAVPFHASLRIRLQKGSDIKDSLGDVVGVVAKNKIVKNKVAPPKRHTEFPIMFHSGIDEEQSLYNYLHEKEVIIKSGGSSKINLDNQEMKFKHDAWKEFYKTNKESILILIDKMMVKDYDTDNESDDSADIENVCDEVLKE